MELTHQAAPTWSARQQRVLASMEVERYVRRALPASSPGPAPPGRWSETDCSSPLAVALARAAGAADVTQFGASFAPLPDLAQLRREPAAKRALWRALRSHRSRA